MNSSACASVSSNVEWFAPNRCISTGRTLTFPPGVHRLQFATDVRANSAFTIVPAGTPPDLSIIIDIVPGQKIVAPAGQPTEPVTLRFVATTIGEQFELRTEAGPYGRNVDVILPDQIRTKLIRWAYRLGTE